MLVYAWNHPFEKHKAPIELDHQKSLIQWLSKLLIKRLKSLIKQGYYKQYEEFHNVDSIVRGKILLKESFESFSYKQGKLHQINEEMTHDVLHNQIIKTILVYLHQNKTMDKSIDDEITFVLSHFTMISQIRLTERMFNNVQIHRNNRHYQFIMKLCYFIWQNYFLYDVDEAERKIQDVSRNHYNLATLFENFVKNFYETEIKRANARSEWLNWPAIGEKLSQLPGMKTDVSLSYNGQKFIIDCKFYKNTFNLNFGKEKVHSGHLYQLLAYLKADEAKRREKSHGILLYPKVSGQSVNLSYNIYGFDISVYTLDLSKKWDHIHQRLLEIVNY